MKHLITTKKHVDVDGKDQYFLYIGEGEKQFRMNIGKATFDKVNELNKQEAEKTPTEKKLK